MAAYGINDTTKEKENVYNKDEVNDFLNGLKFRLNTTNGRFYVIDTKTDKTYTINIDIMPS